MKLYYGPKTRSSRALWMLEECGADYDLDVVDVMSGGAPDSFRKVNPMGKVPVLEDDGVTITESTAICAYLADKFPEKNLAPKIGDPNRGAYYRWLFFMSGSLEPAMIQKFLNWKVEREGMVGWGDPDRVIETLRAEIPKDGFLTGEHFTAADLLIGGTLAFLMPSGVFETWPEADAYIARCTDRPARIKASEMDEKLAAETQS